MVTSAAAEAVFAPPGSISEGADIFLIGNNEGYEYSVKTGKIVNLRVHKGPRQMLTIQTSFDRTGGASGSPVFDAKGRAVGLHSMGSDTSSFEVPAAYLADALYALKAGTTPKRGEPGLKLSPVLIADAVKNMDLPAEAVDRIRKAMPGAKKILMVEKSIEPGLLKPGDLLIAAGGIVIGDDSYLFDKIMDSNAGGSAELEVTRNGSTETARIPVADAQSYKTLKFISFGGGLFTPHAPDEKLDTGETSDGALLIRADKGSPFYMPGAKGEDGHRFLIAEFNGTDIKDFDAFEKAVTGMKDKANITFLFRNLNSLDRSLKSRWLTADLKFWPLKIYEWSPADLDWTIK